MEHNPQLAAFQRLLADAHQGGQAKVDALLALSQRTVFVVPWPAGIEGYRTLVNSEGVAALPVFSERGQLEEAARRYGWLDASGAAPTAEVGARKAFSYASKQSLSYVVVDIAAEHALEVTADEFTPLLSAASRRESTGPYAGAGRISSSLIQAVRSTPPPSSVPGIEPVPSEALKAPAVPAAASFPGGVPASALGSGMTSSTDFDASAARFAGGTAARLEPLSAEVPDALYDSLSTVLREYPEVEWACLVNAARGPSPAVPAIGLRVDTGFRQRINELIGALRQAGDAQGASLQVLLLDDATLMRSARGTGTVFFPWRKK
ncbi:MAG: hypothetical protein AB8I08_11105 [Sandaracinaceae bacterium]